MPELPALEPLLSEPEELVELSELVSLPELPRRRVSDEVDGLDELDDCVELALGDELELRGVDCDWLDCVCVDEDCAWTASVAATRAAVLAVTSLRGFFIRNDVEVVPVLPRICALPQAGVWATRQGVPRSSCARLLIGGRFRENL